MIDTLLRLITFLFFAFLLVIPVSAEPDANTWSAYLLDTVNSQLVRADSDGNYTPITLTTNPEEVTSRGMIEISPDGQIAAYCALVNHQNGTSDYTLYVQDLTTGVYLFQKEYPENSCQITGFNVEGTQYVVASAPQYGVTPSDGIIWRIEVFDVATNHLAQVLTSADGVLNFDFFGGDIGFLAHVRHFENNEVTFLAVPNIGMGLGAQLPAYTWSFDGTVTQNDTFGWVNGAYNADNGFAYPSLDENLSYVQPSGPVPVTNIVNIAQDDAIETIYTNTDWVVMNTTWVDDGNQLAILLLEGENGNHTTASRYDVYDFERDMLYSFDQRYKTYTQIANIPNGALLTWGEMQQGGSLTYFATIYDGVLYHDDSMVYEAAAGARGYAFLELIWTGQ